MIDLGTIAWSCRRWSMRRCCERLLMISILLASFVAADSNAARAAGDSEQAITLYEEALDFFNEGEFVSAIIQLKNVLQEDPRHLAARILIGRSYLMLGDGSSAESELNKARDLGADDSLVLIPLGQSLFLQRRFQDLLKSVRNGGFMREVESDILVLRGKAYAELRKLGEAEKAFQAAAGLAPEKSGPLLGLARVEINRGDRNRARYLIEEAISAEPEDIDGLFMLGELNKLEGDLNGAIEWYGRVIAVQPGHLPARTSRAAALIDLNRHAQAMDDIQEIRSRDELDPYAAYLESLVLANSGDMKAAQVALKDAELIIRNFDPKFIKSHPPTLLTASLIAYAQGSFDDARIYVADYVSKDPAHVGARRLLANLQLRNGESHSAVATLLPAAEQAPDNPEILGLLGSALLQNGEIGEARRTLTRAIDLAPDVSWLRAQRARTLIAENRGDDAAADLEAALESNPGQLELMQLLAVVYLENQNFDQAFATANDLIAIDPELPEHHDVLGAAHMGLSELVEARTAFDKALLLDPEYLNARSNLAQLEQIEGNLAAARAHYMEMQFNPAAGTAPLRALARIAQSEGDLSEAILWLEKLRSVDGDDVGAQMELTELYIANGQPQQALFVARKLRTSNSGTPPILETLGRAQIAAGELSDAVKTFQSMVHGARYSAPRLYQIAQYLIQAEDHDEAYRTLEKAILSEGDNLLVLDALVQIDAREGRIDLARDRILQFEVIQPGHPFAAQLRGDVLMREERYAEAVNNYEEAFDGAPSTVTLLRLYLAYREDQRTKAALPLLEAWLVNQPGDQPIRRTLATGYMEIGDLEKAIAAHEELERLVPEDAVILNNLAWLYFQTSDERALEYARRAHELAPSQAPTIDTLGWILVNNDQVTEGLNLLREASSRDANSPRIRYHLAYTLERVGRVDEARRELRSLLTNYPDSEVAGEARALLGKLGG